MTIREIAAACGVSRGTVDRVINGRGKVRPETEMCILEMLQKAGYQKNIVGRALTVRKNNPVITVILSSENNPFFDEVIEGIKKAEMELADYGASIQLMPMRGYKKEKQLALIQEASKTATILILQPINDSQIVHEVNRLYDDGIRTITINTDIEGSRRICYVGSDYIRGGRVAAGILGLVTGGKGELGIISGVETVLGHRQRLDGFVKRLNKAYPSIHIANIVSSEDDSEEGYRVTHEMLTTNSRIDTLMVIAAGLPGVCHAIRELGREKYIRVFAFDNTPATKAGMQDGFVKAVICQQPFEQGYRAVKTAFDVILSGNVATEKIIMENQVKIIENLDEIGGI